MIEDIQKSFDTLFEKGYEEGYKKAKEDFARPHGEWIPRSERFPERDEIVLVSFKTGIVQICKYLDDGSENPWWSYIDDCCAWNNTVDAWMPLPDPYKKEGDRNEM